ncbi:MAG TPA: hypothetical protein VLN59_11205, partial [Burkholderiales bacterium]|nr:hypothetical protein [Burkholderiales bacterium]
VQSGARRDVESHCGFQTKIECIADAKMHGFASHDAEEAASSLQHPELGDPGRGARANPIGHES